MQFKGRIKKWDDDKGFGFITSATDNREYFFHISAVQNRGQRPEIGEEVTFHIGKDKQGRTRALKVTPAKREKSSNPALSAFIASASFLSVVFALWASGYLPTLLLWLYLGASSLSFLQYAVDKSAARKGKRRTPEITLHQIAVLGGWPGALFAQQLFRHKSSKISFRRVFWLTVFINIAALSYLLTPQGSGIMATINRLTPSL